MTTPPSPAGAAGAASHEPRLQAALRALLAQRRTAALGTLGPDGTPQVSMVPWAAAPGPGCLVLHVSTLAPHTRNLQAVPAVSLLVAQGEEADAPVHALARVSIDARAQLLQPDDPHWQACRDAYLARFPEAEPMTQLGDFRFCALWPQGARHVAGFGAARSVDAPDLVALLGR